MTHGSLENRLEEKVLMALGVVCFTEAIYLFLYHLLPVVLQSLLGF
jgi:hypothetical protein